MIVLSSIHDPQLVMLLQAGAVGVLPTDTIYGLVASATQPVAVAKLYDLKDRLQKPGTVIAASLQQLQLLGLDALLLEKVAHLWPNPLSIVIDAPSSLDYLHQEVGSLAVRIPRDPSIIKLLLQTGPLLTSSANHPGQPAAQDVFEAQRYFADEVQFYIDGGMRTDQPASTVARLLANGSLEVLRPGAVLLNEKGELA
ncbi:MAG TPA: Sua5/YciO/YrdC/YwlC family protein [Candidatus Saccharimonadales bacterium]|nr:Sua5/YciO/YrdC/YwlC family protein [Candidatus Saccharimonadales bacterium]